MVAITGFDEEQIRSAVRKMYGEVAEHPSKEFHFPTGRRACLYVGYPEDWLDALPQEAVESFAGVNFPFSDTPIRPGHTVLDVGAGSGTDALTCARLVGASGKVYALDITPAMLAKLRAIAAKAGVKQLELIEGDAARIPLPDASVDVVTSNGVLNLVPDKCRAIAEIFRVLRPGGSAHIADIVVARAASEQTRANAQYWAECIVGAILESQYVDLLRSTGFTRISASRHFDYFAGSTSPDTRKVAHGLGAMSVVFAMHRPSQA